MIGLEISASLFGFEAVDGVLAVEERNASGSGAHALCPLDEVVFLCLRQLEEVLLCLLEDALVLD